MVRNQLQQVGTFFLVCHNVISVHLCAWPRLRDGRTTPASLSQSGPVPPTTPSLRCTVIPPLPADRAWSAACVITSFDSPLYKALLFNPPPKKALTSCNISPPCAEFLRWYTNPRRRPIPSCDCFHPDCFSLPRFSKCASRDYRRLHLRVVL